MKGYQVISLIGAIAEGISRLKEGGVFVQNKPILIYGLDRYAFAMRTILEHKGYEVSGYISDDEAAVIKARRDTKDFACRYLNSVRDLIEVNTLREKLNPMIEDVAILIASKNYPEIAEALQNLGYCENVHFFKVYDFWDEELEALFAEKKPITLKEMQQKEKEVLQFIDRLCTENQLRYWVCGGTLLGTIRHQGFIPWDDDIDVFMPWEDYLKLMDIFPKDTPYHMIGMGASDANDFSDVFAKIVVDGTLVEEDVGTVKKVFPLWIDVFPLIGLPSDENERHVFFTMYKELDKQIWQDFYAGDGDTGVFAKWYPKQKELLGRYDFDRSDYVGVLGTVYAERDCTHRTVYDSTLRMPFDDIEVNVPTGYKEYLDNLYGFDWMQLPDESKRKSHHNIRTCWL